jgi:hypothetical protein
MSFQWRRRYDGYVPSAEEGGKEEGGREGEKDNQTAGLTGWIEITHAEKIQRA